MAGLVAGLAVITRPRSLGKCTLRDRYPLRESGFQYVYGHEVHADACHKARSLLAPLPSLAPGPRLPVACLSADRADRSAYLGHYPRHWLPSASLRLRSGQAAQDKPWAIPPDSACGWFPTPALPESHCRVIPFRVSILRDFRTVLYAGSSYEWIPYTA